MRLAHPPEDIRDTSFYPPLCRRLESGQSRSRKLADLVYEELQVNFQSGEHSSVEDAKYVSQLWSTYAYRLHVHSNVSLCFRWWWCVREVVSYNLKFVSILLEITV
jgi:hypothetical protein